MSSIPVCEWMDRDNAMTQSDGDFIFAENCVVNPVSAIVEHVPEFDSNLILVDTKILVRGAELSCPLPYISKHPLVQFPDKILSENLPEVELSRHRPFDCPLDAELFKFIKLSTCGYRGDEKTFLLIFIQRCLTIRDIEI